MSGFGLDEHKPWMAMVATQCIYAVMNLVSKAAFNRGFSTMVFVVYRQSFATLFIIPFTLIAKRFVGATAIIGGLYVVLWGKTDDLKRMKGQRPIDLKKKTISIDTESQNWETDMQQPLLTNKSELE